MPLAELPEVAQALREQVLHNVARTGGHLSANLGTVELTLALHRVLDTPHDRLIWDVGHQSYPHKILTGRLDRMPTLRKKGGLSGFPHREESEFDAFGTAHSSTSISAALGMAMAARLRGERRRVVAVIGDGALSAGLAYEAMNHAGQGLEDLVIVLNDNDMSISPPVGSMNQYLSRIMQGRFYEALKQPQHDWVKTTLTPLFELAEHFEKGARLLVEHETLFAKLGLWWPW
jgi:1-deoxy-D-xylulose-5-phosphate synthase